MWSKFVFAVSVLICCLAALRVVYLRRNDPLDEEDEFPLFSGTPTAWLWAIIATLALIAAGLAVRSF